MMAVRDSPSVVFLSATPESVNDRAGAAAGDGVGSAAGTLDAAARPLRTPVLGVLNRNGFLVGSRSAAARAGERNSAACELKSSTSASREGDACGAVAAGEVTGTA